MRKLSLFICIIFSCVILAANVSAITFNPGFDIYSDAAYLVNLDTGEVVYQKNGDKQRTPASLTKIMTAIILLEEYKDNIPALSTTYVSGPSTCFDELYMTGCSNADIRIGEELSYMDLLYALMLRSACEAANIIAYNVAGSLEGFVTLMNEKAAELGCENTHFTNSHGLFWEDHYTTAHDMAIITQYALSLPMFAEISCSQKYEMEATNYHGKPRTITHTNYMMSKADGGDFYYEYVRGIKTGTLDEAGRCLASLANKDGYSYLCITMGAPMKDENGNNYSYNFVDHKNIYEWAFGSLEYTDIILGTEEKAEVSVEYGVERDYVIVKPAETYSRIWNSDIPLSSIHEIITLDENVIAPVRKGDKLGTLELQYGGETLVAMDLIATTDLERSKKAEMMTIAESFIGSDSFYDAVKWALGFFLCYTVLIITLKIIFRSQNKKRSKIYSGGKVKRYK